MPANAYLSFKTKLNCLFFQEVFQPYPVSYTLASLQFHIPCYQTYHAEWVFFLFPCWTISSLLARAILIPC